MDQEYERLQAVLRDVNGALGSLGIEPMTLVTRDGEIALMSHGEHRTGWKRHAGEIVEWLHGYEEALACLEREVIIDYDVPYDTEEEKWE